MASVLRLRPGTAVISRDSRSVQVGSDLNRHVVLTDLTDNEMSFLESLGRAAQPSEFTGTPSRSSRPGVQLPQHRRDAIEAALRNANMIAEDQCTTHLSLRVEGATAATFGMLCLLGDSATLTIDIRCRGSVDPAISRFIGQRYLGQSLAAAMRSYVHDVGASATFSSVPAPDLVVVSAQRFPDPGILAGLASAEQPHIVLTRTESGYMMSPIIIPGVTPCFFCAFHPCFRKDPQLLRHMFQASRWRLAPIPRRIDHYVALLLMQRVASVYKGEECGQALSQNGPELSDVVTLTDAGTVISQAVTWDPDCGCRM
ncbi:hypothetical protein [Schaalia sp. ZJ1691]|uniref:hypothetical protein n=1 Tax=Schaalia sp. ZJ1691 TaxID=2709404 RepID=UPI0013EAA0AF|nr:hypothetical protein [Schaalia sp. ZJ1691]